MSRAVANRQIEPFETAVTLPEWQLEPDDEAYFGNEAAPDNTPPQVNGDGLPADQPPAADQQLDQQWLDGVLNKGRC